jgi:predicted nucleic acid-binding protein
MVREEARAINYAVKACKAAGYPVIGSEIVEFELEQMKDNDRRKKVVGFYRGAIDVSVAFSAQSLLRADELKAEGVGKMDSCHLAIAEAEGAYILITTDVGFIKICLRKCLSAVKVINPLNFVKEIAKWA